MTIPRLYSNLPEIVAQYVLKGGGGGDWRGHLADAIDEVAEEEDRGADEELLPPGAVREGQAEERPPLLLPSGHGEAPHPSKSKENETRIRSMAAGCAG